METLIIVAIILSAVLYIVYTRIYTIKRLFFRKKKVEIDTSCTSGCSDCPFAGSCDDSPKT